MPMIPPDSISALVEYLKNDADVSALAGTKVYGVEIPANQAASMPEYAIVIKPTGGQKSGIMQGVYFQRVDVRTYGKSPKEANDLQRACIQAIEKIEHTIKKNAILYFGNLESNINYLREPSPANWPFTFTVWSIGVNIQSFTNN
jgi:hypothetical protein